MDATRLQEVSQSLFGDENWRKGLANYLRIDESTVCRWVKKDRVPWGIEVALEQCFRWGLYKDPAEVARG